MLIRRAPHPIVTIAKLALAALVVMGATGCGKKSEDDWITRNCKVSADQQASFKGKASEVPFQILVDQDFDSIAATDFDPEKMAQQWNDWARPFGYDHLFSVVRSQAVPTNVKSGALGLDKNVCNATSTEGTSSSFYLVRGDSSSWSTLSLNAATQGSTLQCISNHRIERQAIYINPTTTNTQQLNSVILHELGHALGLNHSCASGFGDDVETDGYGSCNGLAADHPYRVAVMYPVLALVDPLAGMATGSAAKAGSVFATLLNRLANPLVNATAGGFTPEVKETIRPNDALRGECLYNET